jgi:hypothetical protein
VGSFGAAKRLSEVGKCQAVATRIRMKSTAPDNLTLMEAIRNRCKQNATQSSVIQNTYHCISCTSSRLVVRSIGVLPYHSLAMRASLAVFLMLDTAQLVPARVPSAVVYAMHLTCQPERGSVGLPPSECVGEVQRSVLDDASLLCANNAV